MKWFLKCMNNYATFAGRASRTEYWMFTLIFLLLILIVQLVDYIIFDMPEGLYLNFSGILFIVLFMPHLAVSVRRLHDIGKSGWWYFISLIPIIGEIWLLVLLCTKSQTTQNRYGEFPIVE